MKKSHNFETRRYGDASARARSASSLGGEASNAFLPAAFAAAGSLSLIFSPMKIAVCTA